MDRDAFPTLTEGDTGWPQLNIPIRYKASLVIEVYEDEGGHVVHITAVGNVGPIRVLDDVNGER